MNVKDLAKKYNIQLARFLQMCRENDLTDIKTGVQELSTSELEEATILFDRLTNKSVVAQQEIAEPKLVQIRLPIEVNDAQPTVFIGMHYNTLTKKYQLKSLLLTDRQIVELNAKDMSEPSGNIYRLGEEIAMTLAKSGLKKEYEDHKKELKYFQ